MIRKGQLAGLLVTTVVVLGVSACGDSNDNATGPVGAGVTAENSEPQTDPGLEQRRAGRGEGTIKLGDLNKPKDATEVGAPFDPCTTITWADFPGEVRPTDGKPHPPQLRAPEKDDPFDVRCLFDNSGAITLDSNGDRTGAQGSYFMVSVVWGTKLEADPAKRKGSEAKTWTGKSGLIHRMPDDPKTGKGCIGLATLGSGVGGVAVTNSRFGTDACAVVDALMGAITTRSK
ncbi:hypothetical protein [Alloactinosynnema sp. L-07]|nr:hypothetical protein [Alloactinosynnema sp. L-07]